MGNELARLYKCLFQFTILVIHHPINADQLNISEAGHHLTGKWYWMVNLVTFDGGNCSIN